MRLNNVGVTPTVTPNELMPTRQQLAQFWGPKYNSGYTFDSHGSTEYEEYTRELFIRVLQVQWPLNSVLPYHFARGLLAEARGEDVNWAEFAFIKTHPHQSRDGIPRVLPEFENLGGPLPPLIKVIPDASNDEVFLTPLPHCYVHLITLALQPCILLLGQFELCIVFGK